MAGLGLGLIELGVAQSADERCKPATQDGRFLAGHKIVVVVVRRDTRALEDVMKKCCGNIQGSCTACKVMAETRVVISTSRVREMSAKRQNLD